MRYFFFSWMSENQSVGTSMVQCEEFPSRHFALYGNPDKWTSRKKTPIGMFEFKNKADFDNFGKE